MAVDSSAIENTATKIIMNTPAKDACEELGSALALSEEQTDELSRLNVGVAAVFQKGWLSPVLMKVDKWDDRYNTEVEYTDQSLLRVFRGEIVTMLLEQYKASRFSPMKLRSVIKNSGLTADKKREMDEIVSGYNKRLFETQNRSRKVIGQLLMELIGCEGLFQVIPLDGIPTYNEFSKYEAESNEFAALVQRYEKGTGSWFERFFNALNLYLVMGSDKAKAEVILLLLEVAGNSGKIKLYRNSRITMLCRMMYRIFEIEPQEE